jgi:hypothetical protein
MDEYDERCMRNALNMNVTGDCPAIASDLGIQYDDTDAHHG